MDKVIKRVALVTGGNRGIGKEITRQLARSGYHVVIGCRNEGKGRQTVAELKKEGLNVTCLTLDVNDIQDTKRAIDQIDKEYGRLDVLVNNAGIIQDRGISVLDVDESVIRETFETNFFGVLRLTQKAIALMKKQGNGRIVNLSSGLGAFEILEGLGGLKGSSAAYRISKTMLNALTCLVAQEVKESGIKVNAACPGRVQTDMGGADAPGTVEEGADTAVWLATLDNDGATGGFFRDRQRIAW